MFELLRSQKKADQLPVRKQMKKERPHEIRCIRPWGPARVHRSYLTHISILGLPASLSAFD